MHHHQSRPARSLVAALVVAVAPLGVAAPAQADPPGNNGTVKVAPHGEMDGIPQNTPHPGCVFDVEWYGFDEGEEIISEVTFESWAPTRVPMTVDGPSEVFVGGDPASGAGTGTDEESTEAEATEAETEADGETAEPEPEPDGDSDESESAEPETAEPETETDESPQTDGESTGPEAADTTDTADGFDGEATYTLAFDGEPHPQQGFHVRLTVHTPGSQGADVKRKMFWVEECATEETLAEPEESATPEVAGEQAEVPQASSQVEVLGEQAQAPQAAAGHTVQREVAPTAVDAGLAGTTLAAASSHLAALVVLAGLLLLGAALLLRRVRG